jgi:hypothetical protein
MDFAGRLLHRIGVMAGLVPAIHDFLALLPSKKSVDARAKRGHDEFAAMTRLRGGPI